MIAKLHFLFFPHESNNHRAKALHLSSLTFLLVLIGVFQVGLTLLTQIRPGILGFATNIDPERVISLANQHRAEQGLGSLELNPLLIEAARRKAAEMFLFDCWSHNCNDKSPWWFFKEAGYDYLYAGENLAKDFADSESVLVAWMNSPTHRDNILNGKYREIGIAVVDGVLNGEETTIVVQMFGTTSKTPAIAYAEQTTLAETETPGVKVAQVKEEPPPAPVIEKEAGGSKEGASEEVSSSGYEEKRPLFSGFSLSKAFYLILIGLMIIILAIDSILIYRNQIVRISGKSLVHLSFFIIILISILLTSEGAIL